MKPKLGSGERFAHLEHQLAGKGAHNPGALAAYIGREKYGDTKMNQLAQHGREHHYANGGLVEDPHMNDQAAKMSVLQHIIDLFTGHQLNGLKKKGEKPDLVALSVKAEGSPEALPADAGKGEDGHAEPDGDEDPELLKHLLAEYGDKDDESDPNC